MNTGDRDNQFSAAVMEQLRKLHLAASLLPPEAAQAPGGAYEAARKFEIPEESRLGLTRRPHVALVEMEATRRIEHADIADTVEEIKKKCIRQGVPLSAVRDVISRLESSVGAPFSELGAILQWADQKAEAVVDLADANNNTPATEKLVSDLHAYDLRAEKARDDLRKAGYGDPETEAKLEKLKAKLATFKEGSPEWLATKQEMIGLDRDYFTRTEHAAHANGDEVHAAEAHTAAADADNTWNKVEAWKNAQHPELSLPGNEQNLVKPTASTITDSKWGDALTAAPEKPKQGVAVTQKDVVVQSLKQISAESTPKITEFEWGEALTAEPEKPKQGLEVTQNDVFAQSFTTKPVIKNMDKGLA